MNILSSKKTNDRPELYVPAHLADHYPSALDQVRQSIDGLTYRSWFEDLSHGWLRVFVAESLGATEHHGIIPGAVDRPGAHHVAPVTTVNGREVIMDGPHIPQPYDDMSDADKQRWDAYWYSEEHKDVFTERVDALVAEVLASPARAWEAYQHLVAVAHAADQKTRADEAARQEAQRLLVAQCPVCGDSDTERIGRIITRMLLNGADPKHARGVDILRSCHLCWEYAHEAYLMRNAATSTGENRAELVVAALAWDEA